MKIEVSKNSIENKVSKSGNNYSLQTLWVHLGEDHPIKVEQFVGSNVPPLPPGTHDIDLNNFVSVRQGRLELSQLTLLGKSA